MSYNQTRSDNFDNNFSQDPNQFGSTGTGTTGGVRPSDSQWNNDPTTLASQTGQTDPSLGFTDRSGTDFSSGGFSTGSNVPGVGGNRGADFDSGRRQDFGLQQDTTRTGAGNQDWDRSRGDNFNTAGSTGIGGVGTTWNNQDNQRSTGTGGASDSFDNSGAGGGQVGENWDRNRDHNRDRADFNRRDETGNSGPTMGDKLKGGLEKMAGRVAGNPDMVERGEERKRTGSDNPSSNF